MKIGEMNKNMNKEGRKRVEEERGDERERRKRDD